DPERRVARPFVGGAPGVAFCVAFACGVLAAPQWGRSDRIAMSVPRDTADRATQNWLLRNVDHRQRLLVADNYWIFLVGHGFDSHPMKGGFYSRTVVFYWPFDFDPAVKKYFPDGWRDFDYIVSDAAVRRDVDTRQ